MKLSKKLKAFIKNQITIKKRNELIKALALGLPYNTSSSFKTGKSYIVVTDYSYPGEPLTKLYKKGSIDEQN